MWQEAHRHLVADQRPDLLLGVAADGGSAAHDEIGLVQHLPLGFFSRDFPGEERRRRQADQEGRDHHQVEFCPQTHVLLSCRLHSHRVLFTSRVACSAFRRPVNSALISN